jgi:hypothetical protein
MSLNERRLSTTPDITVGMAGIVTLPVDTIRGGCFRSRYLTRTTGEKNHPGGFQGVLVDQPEIHWSLCESVYRPESPVGHPGRNKKTLDDQLGGSPKGRRN